MLSPLDLKNKMIEPKKRRYYDKDEMDEFLELVFDQYKEIYTENQELKKNIKTLSDGVQYYRSIESTMQKALVLAEKTAKETKDAAQLKAEAIEKDANKKAEEIISGAEQEYGQLREKCLYLVQQFNQYKSQLRQVATAQLELVTSKSFDIYSPELEAIQTEKTSPGLPEGTAARPQKPEMLMPEQPESATEDLDKTMIIPDVKEVVSGQKKKTAEDDPDLLTADTIDLGNSLETIRKQANIEAIEPSPAKTKEVQDALVLEPVDAVIQEPLDLEPVEPGYEDNAVIGKKGNKKKESPTLDSLLQSINIGKKNKNKKGQDEDPFEFLGSVDDF